MEDKKVIETIKTYIRDKLKECEETIHTCCVTEELDNTISERACAIKFVLTDLLEQIAWWEK